MYEKKPLNPKTKQQRYNEKCCNLSFKFNMTLLADKTIVDAFNKLSNDLGLTGKKTLWMLIESYYKQHPELLLPNASINTHKYHSNMPSQIDIIMKEKTKSKIGAWRIYRDIKQEELAEYLGVLQSQISTLDTKILKNNDKDHQLADKLARIFSCDPTLLY